MVSGQYTPRRVDACSRGTAVNGQGKRDSKTWNGVKKSEFAKMNKDRQKVVKELLQWVRDKELLFRKRTEEPKKNAPTPPSPERTRNGRQEVRSESPRGYNHK
ncbi:unnamed protein product [Durusdinium trenchii]|uniref:Uncharacterized protein n=1 Tax=Durusdinium trenchii TaxID=1381693 RepID=A0ABP0N0W5_9DINO